MSTYYVATAASSPAGNDANAGTIGAPWLTLAKATATATSGDTVYLRSGTWNEALNLSYKSYASTVTYARYPSDTVGTAILDGTGIDLDPYEEGVVWIKGTNNVTINGLKIINSGHTGICILSATNTDIRNCITDTTARAGIASWSATNLVVYGNTIYNSNMPAGSDEIISIAYGSTNVEVSYNTLYAGNRTIGATGGEGLNIKDGASYVYVHHNTIDLTRADAQNSDRYGLGVDAFSNETHHIYFYDNSVTMARDGIIVESEEGGLCHDIWVYNNLVYDNNRSGLRLPGDWGGSPGVKQNVYFYHNTVDGNPYGAYCNTTTALLSGDIIFRNNIFSNCSTAATEWGSAGADITADHNLTSGDPAFTNRTTHDFHLTGGSTLAVDQGVSVSGGRTSYGVELDYDGDPRPQGGGFDLGAFELGAPIGTPVLTVR